MIPTILSRNQQPLLLISFALTFTVHTRFPLSLSLSFNSYFSELCFVHMFYSPVEQNIAYRSLILLTHPTSVLLSLITYFFCISFTWFVCVCACFHFNPFNNNSNIKKLVQKSLCSFYVKKKEEKKKDNP